MPDFQQVHSDAWLRYFAGHGYPDVRPLATGVEGAVYRLGKGTVAKVWGRRRAPELVRMQRFYADVAAGGLPFDTPVILDVVEADGSAVTYERELHGEPLHTVMASCADGIDERSGASVISILRAMAGVPATSAMKALPVLDEEQPFWASGDFTAALGALLRRRVDRHGPVLRTRAPGFDDVFDRLLTRLQGLDPVAPALIHGDLFGGNVLVDESGRVSAVLDFGFFSTAGDARFDAAVTAAIMDMYGPHAPAVTQALTHRISAELGYPIEILLVYQAAYAVASANFFTEDGSDGHFSWCVEQLARKDVIEALGLG